MKNEIRKGKNILTFKSGDIITRLEKAHCVYGDDGSYIGEKFIFYGMFNNSISGVFPDSWLLKGKSGELKILNISGEGFLDGWGYYEEPHIRIEVTLLDLFVDIINITNEFLKIPLNILNSVRIY